MRAFDSKSTLITIARSYPFNSFGVRFGVRFSFGKNVTTGWNHRVYFPARTNARVELNSLTRAAPALRKLALPTSHPRTRQLLITLQVARRYQMSLSDTAPQLSARGGEALIAVHDENLFLRSMEARTIAFHKHCSPG